MDLGVDGLGKPSQLEVWHIWISPLFVGINKPCEILLQHQGSALLDPFPGLSSAAVPWSYASGQGTVMAVNCFQLLQAVAPSIGTPCI